MRKFLFVLIATIVLSLSASQAEAVVINFDDLIDNSFRTAVPTNYAGLTWDSNWFYWSWAQSPFTPSSPNTRIATHNYGGWFTFANPVMFQGAYFSGDSTAPADPFDEALVATSIYFEGYLGATLIGTSSVMSLSSAPAFLSAGFGSAVDKVVVISATYNHFSMDDVTYREPTIPEPTTILLLGSGFLGLLGFRKKS